MFSSTPSKQTSIIYQQTKLTKSPTRWRLIFTQLEKHAQVKLDHLCKGWGQKNKRHKKSLKLPPTTFDARNPEEKCAPPEIDF